MARAKPLEAAPRPGAAAGGASWWQSRGALRRFVVDLVAGELSHLRPGTALRPRPWAEELLLDVDLGVDSLELMALATAFSQALHLHQSGIEDWLLAKRGLGDWMDIAAAGLAHFDQLLTFSTSGSSGTPKPCLHPLATLQQETRQLSALFPARSRVLSAVPAHHIYGFLFTVLLPRALGISPDAVLDLRGSTPASLGRLARPGDLVIGHPDYWQAVGASGATLPRDVIGVTSTAPCADAVSEAVERSGILRLFQVYGSSETAGIGWRNSHRSPYALFRHWSFAGEDGHALVRRLPGGPDLQARCPDVVERVGERHFRVGVRRDDAVQVGGSNVFPARIREVLLAHPLVQDAAVRLMRPEEGARLKAFVVPTTPPDDAAAFQLQLQHWIDARLPVAARPRSIRIGAELPATATGKPADWQVDA